MTTSGVTSVQLTRNDIIAAAMRKLMYWHKVKLLQLKTTLMARRLSMPLLGHSGHSAYHCGRGLHIHGLYYTVLYNRFWADAKYSISTKVTTGVPYGLFKYHEDSYGD